MSPKPTTTITTKFSSASGYVWTGSSWLSTTKRWHSVSFLPSSEIKKLRDDMECIRKELERHGHRIGSMRLEGGYVYVKGMDGKGREQKWTFERLRWATGWVRDG
ncbi:hypothetical protein Slin14017_G033920 [Septoria linicola]|nr:hypothetical protein Slin14017_G033920 [Septoria linicola]